MANSNDISDFSEHIDKEITRGIDQKKSKS